MANKCSAGISTLSPGSCVRDFGFGSRRWPSNEIACEPIARRDYRRRLRPPSIVRCLPLRPDGSSLETVRLRTSVAKTAAEAVSNGKRKTRPFTSSLRPIRGGSCVIRGNVTCHRQTYSYVFNPPTATGRNKWI